MAMSDDVRIERLEAHAPMPDGRHLTVLRRFDEDNPRLLVTELVLGTGPGRAERSMPTGAGGRPMGLDEAIAAGRAVAKTEGLRTVYVIDRTAGPREREVLEHGGDHSADMEGLDDMDLEEGERGPDMRDTIR